MCVVWVTEHTGGRWSRGRGAVGGVRIHDAGDKRCGQTQSGGGGGSQWGMCGGQSGGRGICSSMHVHGVGGRGHV